MEWEWGALVTNTGNIFREPRLRWNFSGKVRGAWSSGESELFFREDY
jgi:hypothetical protein